MLRLKWRGRFQLVSSFPLCMAIRCIRCCTQLVLARQMLTTPDQLLAVHAAAAVVGKAVELSCHV